MEQLFVGVFGVLFEFDFHFVSIVLNFHEDAYGSDYGVHRAFEVHLVGTFLLNQLSNPINVELLEQSIAEVAVISFIIIHIYDVLIGIILGLSGSEGDSIGLLTGFEENKEVLFNDLPEEHRLTLGKEFPDKLMIIPLEVY